MAQRIYTVRSGNHRLIAQVFEDKYYLAQFINEVPSTPGTRVWTSPLLSREGKAFKSYSVQDYLNFWNEIDKNCSIVQTTAKDFAYNSRLTPAGRKKANIVVEYDCITPHL